MVYAALGEESGALAWLGRAYEERDDGLVYLGVDPLWDGLRADPRFQQLLRRMNLQGRTRTSLAPSASSTP